MTHILSCSRLEHCNSADMQVTSAPGKWLRARIEVNGSAKNPLVEFVVTDNNGNWDKPAEGAGDSSSCCLHPSAA